MKTSRRIIVFERGEDGGGGKGAFVLIKQLYLLNHFSGLILLKDTFPKLVASELAPDVAERSFFFFWLSFEALSTATCQESS